MVNLPDDWIFNLQQENALAQDAIEMVQVEGGSELPDFREPLVPTKGRKKKKEASWGPVVAVRKSKRNIDDNRPVMGRAQEIKRKLCLEQTNGKKMLPTQAFVILTLFLLLKQLALMLVVVV